MAKKKRKLAKRNPLVRPMIVHTKPGPMKDKRRKLIDKAIRKEGEKDESTI
jgi:hypothetical protein